MRSFVAVLALAAIVSCACADFIITSVYTSSSCGGDPAFVYQTSGSCAGINVGVCAGWSAPSLLPLPDALKAGNFSASLACSTTAAVNPGVAIRAYAATATCEASGLQVDYTVGKNLCLGGAGVFGFWTCNSSFVEVRSGCTTSACNDCSTVKAIDISSSGCTGAGIGSFAVSTFYGCSAGAPKAVPVAPPVAGGKSSITGSATSLGASSAVFGVFAILVALL